MSIINIARCFYFCKTIIGTALALGGMYAIIEPAVILLPTFYALTILVGSLYMLTGLMGLERSYQSKYKDTDSGDKKLDFHLEADDLEGLLSSSYKLHKLMKRAAQIQKCKKGTATEALSQASAELKEVADMEKAQKE